VKVDALLPLEDLRTIPDDSRQAEDLGFDGVAVPETTHNPFMALALAAEHTRQIRLSTQIALAFVRSPTTTAYAAFDLQRLSGGRLVLGLGSQTRWQITRRFGMPWSAPAERMHDYIRALHAVWQCWQAEAPLDYVGPHYRLDVMTPNHRPPPLPAEVPLPPVHLAAVGPRMCRVAGDLCAGVRLHPFATLAYVQRVALDHVRRGTEAAGRSLAELEVSGGGMVATGATPEDLRREVEQVRRMIAYYGSFPEYIGVWELHGWQDTGRRLQELATHDRWPETPALVSDEMVRTFAAVGPYADIGERILERFGSFAASVSLPLPAPEHGALLEPSLRLLQTSRLPALG
jgi:probable F420-dependent oxidoreductase